VKALNNESGQAVTEAVMILVLLMGFTFLVANYFKSREVLKQLIQGPFQHLAGMMQNGVWAPPGAGATKHPSSHDRHITVQGDPIQ
jgi:Na+/alanine symporter